MLGMLGIEDPWIITAYLSCIASAVLCVVYGLACWNRGEQAITPEDVKWVSQEKQVEEETT